MTFGPRETGSRNKPSEATLRAAAIIMSVPGSAREEGFDGDRG